MIRASSSLFSHLSQNSRLSRSLLSNPHLLPNPSHSSSYNTLADQDRENPIDESRIRQSRRQEGRAVRQLTLSGNSAACSGRNSQGRITTFHRGGGSKRLKRKIDLKRSTSSMGIVERIEYDPNRSSRIALVRWIEIGHRQKGSKPKTTILEKPALSPPPPLPPKIVLESTVRGPFSFSFMPAAGKKGVDKKSKKIESIAVAGNGNGNVVVVGGSLLTPDGSKGSSRKLTSAKDVFLSALTKGKGEGSSSFGFPRMAVAGAKPGFFAPRIREGITGEEKTFSLCEIRKWRAKTLTGSLRWPQRV